MTHTDVIPTSASIASTGLGIRYIGKHFYCFSGLYAVSTTPVLHLDFTTGSGYIVGKIQCNGAVSVTNIDRGQITSFQIKLNSEIAMQLKTETETEDFPPIAVNDVIIPPFTRVEVLVDSDAADFGSTSVVFVGRVYGAV